MLVARPVLGYEPDVKLGRVLLLLIIPSSEMPN
jgi:hypothetical protein